MANRPGEFDETSSSAEIEESLRLQREAIARQEEQYRGELAAGTPERELETLQREIAARQLKVEEGERIIADRSVVQPPAPATPAPPSTGVYDFEAEGSTPWWEPETPDPAVPPVLPSTGPVIPIPSTSTSTPPATLPPATTTTPGTSPGPITGTGSMITITDEMKDFAHTYFQGVSESVYTEQTRKIDEAIEANDFALAVSEQEEQALIASGQRVPLRVTDTIARTKQQSEFNQGVLEYVLANKSIFGIVPDPVVAAPGTTAPGTTAPAAAAATTAPREKLGLGKSVLAGVAFPWSLAVPQVRSAIAGRTKEILGIRPPLQPGETRPHYLKTKRGKAVAATAVAATIVGGVALSQGGGDQTPVVGGDETPGQVAGEEAFDPACGLTEDIARQEGRDSLEATEGDSIAAIEIAKEQLEAVYGDTCDPAAIEQGQEIAVAEINEQASATPTTANVPGGSGTTPTTEPEQEQEAGPTTVPEAEVDGTVYCTDGSITYDDGTPAVDDIPFGLWEGNDCDTQPGQVVDHNVGEGQVIRELGW